MICVHEFFPYTKYLPYFKITVKISNIIFPIEVSESLTGETAYCLSIHDHIVEFILFTRKVKKRA